MVEENKHRLFTLIGSAMLPQNNNPKYRVKSKSVVLTCSDPQIWEMECEDGTLLYVRFSNGELSCKEKKTGVFICSGCPAMHKVEIPEDKLEFYLEMYSRLNIFFL